MKLLITGICGFAGSTLARPFREHFADWSISGVDNLSRPGSEINRSKCVNVSGGLANSMSLAQLSEWCRARFGQHWIASELISHRFDVPWLILDSRYAAKEWHWKVETPINSILEEIGLHAEARPEWLQLSGAENE